MIFYVKISDLLRCFDVNLNVFYICLSQKSIYVYYWVEVTPVVLETTLGSMLRGVLKNYLISPIEPKPPTYKAN